MQDKEWHNVIDKSGWGEGPWHEEPDKEQWTDEASGYPCMIRRNPMFGHLCGYVGVPPGHQLYGVDTESIPPELHACAHREVNYAAPCDEGDPELGICHVTEPGDPEPAWWFGFDCGHFSDLSPAFESRQRAMSGPSLADEIGLEYRDRGYVRAQCEALAVGIVVCSDNRVRGLST